MFSTLEKIKELAKKRGISLARLEENLGYSTNYFYTLKTKTPNSDRLQEIADYFNVSTDYLLGRTDNPNIAPGASEESLDSGNGELYSIQRKAKSLSVEDRKRLLQLMDITFHNVLNGGEDNEHDL